MYFIEVFEHTADGSRQIGVIGPVTDLRYNDESDDRRPAGVCAEHLVDAINEASNYSAQAVQAKEAG